MPPSAGLFELHPSSGIPIYRQLIDQVRALIAGGRLVPGDMLPSVREVARAAEVNPMTVSKAYSRLEIEGVVERVRGQGMRILEPNTGGPLRERRQEFRDLAAPAIHRALQLGLTDQQIHKAVDQLLEEQAARHSND
ncbi:GntR family transcriptional regulator [Lacipirellula limnantheis]|uniref:HTH-type transcriptional repressor YtrA n=1 Tax=Lacipirellula limnantheis TaxID=2528024 RepID=A0A517U6F8_9BACT|nr:GntR family transcriptional regulator [Lacipirellula limnantheis]QDT76217.1 HTH-type transcriptional repressor YtrA [Lacipirellula limnantheis]